MLFAYFAVGSGITWWYDENGGNEKHEVNVSMAFIAYRPHTFILYRLYTIHYIYVKVRHDL